MADGDGARYRAAIADYAAWYRTARPPVWQTVQVPSSVTTKMTNEFSQSAYQVAQKTAIVNQIIACYNSRAINQVSVAIPTTDKQTLAFLGIQRQCLEWADSISLASNGHSENYSSTPVTNPRDFRPGMALMQIDSSGHGIHTMIIVDIDWNASGNPTAFKVAEANYASAWQNPVGQIPWSRTVQVGRTVQWGAGYQVVNFEG